MSIAQEPVKKFGTIIVDVFSSDAIPIHIITKEAVENYLTKLLDDGIIVVHISNRHFDLRPVLSAVASELGLGSILNTSDDSTEDSAVEKDIAVNKNTQDLITHSAWVVLSKDTSNLDIINKDVGWKKLDKVSSDKLWTDDFSNILGILR